MFSNDVIGIDLGIDGPTPNDPGDADTGANNFQNFPSLAAANVSSGSTTVTGTLHSTSLDNFALQFFSNPSGEDEGKIFLGKTGVTTNSEGNASFGFTAPVSIPGGSLVTATATGADNGTSEFSEPAPANTAPVISGFKPKGSTPRIGARVTDGETNLQRSNLKVSLDGKGITRFTYNPSADRLSFTSRKLKQGKHTSKIEATDPEGRSS